MEFKKCQAAGIVWGNPTQEEIKSGVPENIGMRDSSVDMIKQCL